MPTTPTFGIPYPASTDAPNGPAQMGALALEVEAELTAVDARLDLVEAKFPLGLLDIVWTPFTPTWSGMTVGNGTQQHAYTRVGRLVVARYKLTHGTTTVFGTTPTATLPVTASAASINAMGSTATYRDVSAPANYHGYITIPSATQVYFLRAGATETHLGITVSTPFTWASGDTLGGTVVYEAA